MGQLWSLRGAAQEPEVCTAAWKGACPVIPYDILEKAGLRGQQRDRGCQSLWGGGMSRWDAEDPSGGGTALRGPSRWGRVTVHVSSTVHVASVRCAAPGGSPDGNDGLGLTMLDCRWIISYDENPGEIGGRGA